jgi:D-aspartate ligase
MLYGNQDFVPIILGTGLGAYATARALHEAFGVRSLAIGRAALGETMHSAIVDVRVYPGLDAPETVVAVLRDLAAEFPGRTRVIFATIEYYTNVVIDHRAELEADYAIPLVGEAIKRRVIDKSDFYRTCAELGVPHPETVVVTPGTASDPHLGDDLPFGYPVILKPSDTDTYPRLQFEGKEKVYRISDARELRAVAARITRAGYTGDLIVQEFLAGDESVMRVANTYSDRQGRMRLASLGQVVLTEYHPRLVGNNNAIVSVHDDELVASLRGFLDGIGYVGAANFDVMRDRRTGVDKLLEVNLRPGATSFYATAAGANIARSTIEEYVYGRAVDETVTTEERLWLNAPYPVVVWFVPGSLRARVRAFRRRNRDHTLRYGPDRSLRRRVEIARLDARRSLDYVKFAKNRPQP